MVVEAPLVSVCVTTFNHEKYVRRAVESILAQDIDFKIEVLIGEDDSEDSTREIIREIERDYGESVSCFFNNRDDVIYIDGHATGRWNLLNLLGRTRGKYVAILDGDDYWTASEKLQTQVKFLDDNPGYSMVFHDAKFVDGDGNDLKKTYCAKRISEGDVSLDDFIEANMAPTCSALYRRTAITPFQYARTIRAYDWLLVFLAAEKGKIYFLEKVWGAYRSHSGGVWQRMDHDQKVRAEQRELAKINELLGYRYNRKFRNSMANRSFKLAKNFRRKNQRLRSAKQWLKGLILKFQSLTNYAS